VVPAHFEERVRDRLWPVFGPMDAAILYEQLIEAMPLGNQYLTFVSRVSRCGKRIWRVDIPPIGHLYVLIQHIAGGQARPITILMPGMTIGREGKDPIHLE
jgi:hypothetical protein